MRITPTDGGVCNEAEITSLMLELEVNEVHELKPDPSAPTDEFKDGSVRLEGRRKRTDLAAVFLSTTLGDCEVCMLDIPQGDKECPNRATLGFIRDVLL
jgi:hypothetical protein